jgi:hypothetical protein
LAAVLSQWLDEPVTLCALKRLTGVPCATCGSTRAVLHLLGGRVGQAFATQPLVMAAAAIGAVVLGLRVIFARRISLELTRLQRRIGWGVIAALFAANWAYIILVVG